MMPISQLVVHLSYDFWVQLALSDLSHEAGSKAKKGEKRKVGKVKIKVEEK